MLKLNNKIKNTPSNNFTTNSPKRNIRLKDKFCNNSLQNLKNTSLNNLNIKKTNLLFQGKFLGEDFFGKISGKVIDKITNKPIDCVITSKKADVVGLKYTLYAEKIKGFYEKIGFMCINHEHIDTLDSRKGNKFFKNIGKTLLELADELSYKTNNRGELHLTAHNIGGGSPVTFYRKMGYTTGDQFIDNKIDNAINNGNSYSANMLPMFLPEKEILKRRERIKKESFINPDIPENATEYQRKRWLDFIYDWTHKFKGVFPDELMKKARNIAENFNSQRYNPDDYHSL